MLNLISFEYTLLEFDELLDWIYSAEDEFRDIRAKVISARNSLVETIRSGNLNYKAIREVIEYDENVNSYNIEQFVSKILKNLTRNTGFEVSKSKVGECWIKSCCDFSDRKEDDICGLDDRRLLLRDKMKKIYYGTSLSAEFTRIGMGLSI